MNVSDQITGGIHADYLVCAVRTGGKGMGGLSLLVVERTEGVKTTQMSCQGVWASGTSYVTFEDVKVGYILGALTRIEIDEAHSTGPRRQSARQGEQGLPGASPFGILRKSSVIHTYSASSSCPTLTRSASASRSKVRRRATTSLYTQPDSFLLQQTASLECVSRSRSSMPQSARRSACSCETTPLYGRN